MTEREQLEQAIASLESQRASLGNAAVDAALLGLRRKLSALEDARVSGKTPPESLGPALVGERKLVTVMFADFSGFTAMSEKADPESVRDLLNGCFKRLVPVIEKYEGTIDKFTGDGVMALFGAPLGHEDDPERALRAALDMMDALDVFNAERGLNLALHFGINTGLVIAGTIGTGQRQEYSVIGDTVNLASRLEGVAERREILVGPDTHRLALPIFTFEALQPVRVKGKTDAVQPYRLVGLRAKRRRPHGLTAKGIDSSLVGRDGEFAAVNACIERLSNGQGGILSIIGEAGVGKSRLMAQVRQQTLPVKWLEGRTLSFGQTISYWPFQEILWQYAGITEDDSESFAWHKLESKVTALFAEGAAEILPYLAALLSLEVKDEYVERIKYLDGEAMGRQVFLATHRFFERLAQSQPLVLVFEDLHWGDQSSALLLEHLFPLVRRVRLMICGVSRQYPGTPAARLQEIACRDFSNCYTEIRLAPLSETDSAQLMHNLLEMDDFSSAMQDMIVRKAGGNPFFLEEIIRTLIDTRAVVQDPETGRWEATAQIESIVIPDTIQGVIMARVDRLADDAKQVLRTAAVIGRSFFYRVLHAVAEADRKLDDHLNELQAVEFIREKQGMPELEYIFKHALVQEATYESVLLQKRRELHAHVGQVVEVVFADRLEEFYSLLAYHYARAEAWEKAQEYLFKAGDQAGRIAADAEALSHYRQALDAYERAFGDKWDPVQRAALERKMGEALFRRGEHSQALEYFQRALTYLGKPLPTSHWGMRLAIPKEIAIQIGHRLFPRLAPKPMDEPISPVIEEEVRSYEAIGWIDAFESDERLLLLTLRLLNVSERSGFPYGVAIGLMALGLISDLIAFFRIAEYYHRRAVPFAERIQHSSAIGLAYIGLALHKMCLAEWDAVIKHARRAAAVYKETGDVHNWGYSTFLQAGALAYKGDFTQSLRHCRDIVRIGREGGDPQTQCWGLTLQGFVERVLGQSDEAIATLRRAAEMGDATQDYRFCIWSRGEAARYYLQYGEERQARAALKRSEEFQDEHNTVSLLWLPYWNGLAEVNLVAAEEGDESEQADRLKKAGRACRDALKHGKAYRGVMPEAMRLQGTYQWLRGRPSAARKWWQRSLTLAESMGQRYDLGMTHLEMGKRLDDEAHRDRGEAILTEIL